MVARMRAGIVRPVPPAAWCWRSFGAGLAPHNDARLRRSITNGARGMF